MGVDIWYPNTHYELASLADSFASVSCFSKSHSDYTVNISSTLLPGKYVAHTYFMSLPKSRYLARLLKAVAA